jgi:hypothetical protein
MTAQHPKDEHHDPAEAGQADPIGPITTPKRSLIGSRALALVGATSFAAVAVQVITDGCSTITTIGNPH